MMSVTCRLHHGQSSASVKFFDAARLKRHEHPACNISTVASGAPLNAFERASIVEAAVLAPSADNHHCFELHVSDDRVLLFGNRAYASAPFHRKVLALVSFGAVVENMRIRAAFLGYQARIHWMPDVADASLIAEMHLTKAESAEATLDSAIPRRHTNRRLAYRGPRLNESELAEFSKAVASVEGVSLQFMDSRASRAKLLRLLRIAEAERFNTRSLHEELFSAVRFDVGWHGTVEEGLAPSALSIEPGMRWAFRQIGRWPVMNVLRALGFHHILGFRAAHLPCQLAPHCAVLATTLPVERGAPAVGMALERIWLQATASGLALQPFAAPALLALQDYVDVPSITRGRLQSAWRELLADTPLIVFRMGFAKSPEVRSGRPRPTLFIRS